MWWRFLLFATGVSTMIRGLFSDWVSDGSFRLQDHPGGGLLGLTSWLVVAGAFSVIGWFIYTALAFRKRAPPRSPEIAKASLATAGFATFGFALVIVLLVAAYDSIAPPSTLLEASGPQATVTPGPWLALEGMASLVIGGVSLWRSQRPRVVAT